MHFFACLGAGKLGRAQKSAVICYSQKTLFTSCHTVNLSNCESVKRAFFKIVGFVGKRFLFWPPLPIPTASISVALAPIFAQPKSEKRLQRAESPTETLATQAKI